MNNKIKVLAWMDYCCNTGFATVARNVLKNLYDTGDFEIDVVGINYDGDPYDKNEWVGNVFPAMRGRMLQPPYIDVFGRQRVLDLLSSGKYDVLFMIQDTFVTMDFMPNILEAQKATNTKTVYYYPIDAEPHVDWITQVISKVNYPITYTKYAFDESVKHDPALKSKLEVIYHGTNTEEFYPIKEDLSEFKKAYFDGVADNKFIIMNLNRNQPRKDILRSLLIQKELKERGRNTLLYLHMADVDVGGDITQWAAQLGLEFGNDFVFPGNFREGFPIQIVNQLYNTVDCLLTTTHGEGWGLSLTEAMATKLPIVAPDVTSISEILADNRGFLVPAGKTNHDWYTQGQGDNNRLRPLMDVEAGADAVERIIDGELPDVEAAYRWATEQTWDVITEQFEKTIRKAASGRPKLFQTPDGKIVPLTRAQQKRLEKQNASL